MHNKLKFIFNYISIILIDNKVLRFIYYINFYLGGNNHYASRQKPPIFNAEEQPTQEQANSRNMYGKSSVNVKLTYPY